MTSKNVLRMPYAVAPRDFIETMILRGHLHRFRRHDTEAIERALDALIERVHEHERRT